jgi:hypothetical protein
MGILFAAVFSGIGIIWDRHFGFLKPNFHGFEKNGC